MTEKCRLLSMLLLFFCFSLLQLQESEGVWLGEALASFDDPQSIHARAEWTVPDNPRGIFPGERLYYFLGVQCSKCGLRTSVPLLQPVLAYNWNYCPAEWCITSMIVFSDTLYKNSTPIHVSTGDVVIGEVSLVGDRYVVNTTARGQSTGLTIPTPVPLCEVVVTVEMRSDDGRNGPVMDANCDAYPAHSIPFSLTAIAQTPTGPKTATEMTVYTCPAWCLDCTTRAACRSGINVRESNGVLHADVFTVAECGGTQYPRENCCNGQGFLPCGNSSVCWHRPGHCLINGVTCCYL